MGTREIRTVLFISVILAIACPIIGLIPLSYSLTARQKYKRGNPSYYTSLKKAERWLEIGFIIWILAAFLFAVFFELAR